MYGGRDWHNCKIITQIQFVCWPLKHYSNSLKYKMLCSEQLIAKPCPFFTSIRLAHKSNTCFPFFLAASEHVISMKNDDLLLSKMSNTEMNACYKILRAGYCLLVVMQENVFSRCTITKGYFSISHNLPNFFLTVQNKCINFSLPERHVQGDQPER